MSTTLSKKFSSVFDPSKEAHVMWLKALHEATVGEKSPNDLMMGNPFDIKVTKNEILEWVEVLFSLAMKYSMAVLAVRRVSKTLF